MRERPERFAPRRPVSHATSTEPPSAGAFLAAVVLLVVLGLLPLCAPVDAEAATAPPSVVFDQPGTRSYLVPAGVCSVKVRARGAAGGRGETPPSFFWRLFGEGGAPGSGGEVTGTIDVAGGQLLVVTVGEQGQLARGGFGGGGDGAAGG